MLLPFVRCGHHRRPAVLLLLVASSVLLVARHSTAGEKTYTPQQLCRMISKGQYPPQGPVKKVGTRQADFGECVATANSFAAAVKPNYPAETLVDTKIAKMFKIWTNDGAVTVLCSAPDGKMVVTIAPYR